jgi:carboxyl-terminal processing protease
MRWTVHKMCALFLTLFVFLAAGISPAIAAQKNSAQKSVKQTEQRISRLDRERAELMLRIIRQTLKKNYYDPSFHGVDMDAEYNRYEHFLKSAHTLSEAFGLVSDYLDALRDTHTYFVPRNGPERFGYGFRMRMVGDRCLITDVRPGSDAAAKLQPGDELLRVDHEAVTRQNLAELRQHLKSVATRDELQMSVRDPQGNVRSGILLKKFALEKPLTNLAFDSGDQDIRGMADAEQSLGGLLRERWVELGATTLIWKMPWFGMDQTSTDAMMDKARKHATLILDLRDNPGGSINCLSYLVGWFFRHSVMIARPIGRSKQKEMIARPHRGPFEGKLIVLVDSRSASAAELFARVMQLEHRGMVIGERTAGAVMESRLYFFHFGIDPVIRYEAVVTRADLIMNDGKSLEGVGVTPDVIVLPTGADLAAGRDPVLAQAVQLAGAKLDPVAAGKLFPFEWAPLQ